MRLRLPGLAVGLCFALLFAGCGGGGGNNGSTTTTPTSPTTPTTPAALAISTTTLAGGTAGTAYSATLAATGGTAPYTWSVVQGSGSLPADTSLSTGGVISGTPTTTGTSSFTVQVKDAESPAVTATQKLTLTIGGTSVGALTITAAAPPNGLVGTAYAGYSFAAQGGVQPYTWSVVAGSGSLPAGLTLSAGGAISGTPTTEGVNSFTVQVADAESPTATATQKVSLLVSGGVLVMTAASPVAGQVGVPYPGYTFAAQNGIPPYTWSVSGTAPLPPGLSFSSSGVLTGTPTMAGSFTFGITVKDSNVPTPDAFIYTNVMMTVNPPANPLPQGNYSFVFSGTGPQGPVVMNGSLLALGGGVLTGYYDKNTLTGPPQVEQNLSNGIAYFGTNGLGQMMFSLADGTTMAFSLASPMGIGTSGNTSEIRMIEFDDTTGKGTRGSGVLKFVPSFVNSASGISGNYAFGFTGTDAGGNRTAIAGTFSANGGSVTGGEADASDGGTVQPHLSISGGTYTVDSTGHGVLKLTWNGNTYTYGFYAVSGTELEAVTDDTVAGSIPLVSGTILQQQTGAFSNASFNGVGLLELNGVAQVSGNPVANLSVGLATGDGNGNIVVRYDQNDNGLLPGLTNYGGTYTVDASGRLVVTSPGVLAPILYLVNANQAFALGTDASTSAGRLELQTASGTLFNNASFKGTYLGGSVALPIAPVTNAVSQVVADGATGTNGVGNVVMTVNSSGPSGLQSNQTVTGTYEMDGTGRAPVTVNGAVVGIFYYVSPTKVVFVSSQANGFVGSFEQ